MKADARFLRSRRWRARVGECLGGVPSLEGTGKGDVEGVSDMKRTGNQGRLCWGAWVAEDEVCQRSGGLGFFFSFPEERREG